MSVTMLVAYALAVAVVLAPAAWFLERAFTGLRLPTRGVWIGALGLCIGLPLAAFVSGPRQRDPAVAASPAQTVAPVAQAEIEVEASFTTVGSEPQRPPSADVSMPVDDGLAVVLPDTTMPGLHQVNVNPRNLLFLDVLPTGIVAARRGEESGIREIAPSDVEALWRQDVALNPTLIAVVRTRPDAEYRHMYDVLDALHRAEATRVSLQVAQ